MGSQRRKRRVQEVAAGHEDDDGQERFCEAGVCRWCASFRVRTASSGELRIAWRLDDLNVNEGEAQPSLDLEFHLIVAGLGRGVTLK